MKVAPIGFFNPKKVQQKSKTPSFQADVRVDYSEIDTFQKRVPEIILPIVKKAETAYENEGSDNILIEVKPVLIGGRGILADTRKYGIYIESSFKDIERARKEILENHDRDYPNSTYKDPDLAKLRERDPEIMERLKIHTKKLTDPCPRRDLAGYVGIVFTREMEQLIHNFKYRVPKEPEPREFVKTFYQGEYGGMA